MELTSFSRGAGCGCKIGAAQLAQIRRAVPPLEVEDLLVGIDPADDAAVYRLTPDLAIVQTIDFFTPIVDDPFDFGRIAAANALSDVYAMGATPILALNVLAASLESLGHRVVEEILSGGATVAAEAGIPVAGGHSIDDDVPKYGMAVTGVVGPDTMLTKGGGKPGDRLFLTKPIGVGLITTAAKRGRADTSLVGLATDVMTTLNHAAAEEARRAGATALTDVTGFGLLGHLHEMCLASGLQAELDARAVPKIDGAEELARDRACQAGGSRRNEQHAEEFVRWDLAVADHERVILTDAQTSGGLLVAVPKKTADRAPGVCIGQLREGMAGIVEVVPTT